MLLILEKSRTKTHFFSGIDTKQTNEEPLSHKEKEQPRHCCSPIWPASEAGRRPPRTVLCVIAGRRSLRRRRRRWRCWRRNNYPSGGKRRRHRRPPSHRGGRQCRRLLRRVTMQRSWKTLLLFNKKASLFFLEPSFLSPSSFSSRRLGVASVSLSIKLFHYSF